MVEIRNQTTPSEKKDRHQSHMALVLVVFTGYEAKVKGNAKAWSASGYFQTCRRGCYSSFVCFPNKMHLNLVNSKFLLHSILLELKSPGYIK